MLPGLATKALFTPIKSNAGETGIENSDATGKSELDPNWEKAGEEFKYRVNSKINFHPMSGFKTNIKILLFCDILNKNLIQNSGTDFNELFDSCHKIIPGIQRLQYLKSCIFRSENIPEFRYILPNTKTVALCFKHP